MIRILHIITGLALGGAESTLAKLLARMDRSAFSSMVVCLKEQGGLVRQIEECGTPVHALDMRLGLRAPGGLRRLASLVRQFQPALLQGWLCHGNLAVQIAASFASRTAPVLWNIRSSLDGLGTEKAGTRVLTRALRRVSSRPRHIIYNSRLSASQHEQLGYDSRRTVVIPNGFDLALFRPRPECRAALRNELGLPEETPLIGLIARYHPVKDHANFLCAAAGLVASCSSAHFVLAGTGTRGPELMKRISELGLRERVHALGERQDIAEVTAGLDVATSCSVSEGFPNAIGEAMAAGVPCVATAVGDSPAVVGTAGRVIPRRDPSALCTAWREMLAMPVERRRQLGEQARQRVTQEFSLGSMVAAFENLYREAVQ